jgi:putative transposase
VFALRQAEVGTPVAELCRKMGVSEATYYRWKQLYGGMRPSKLRKMRQLDDENQKLKHLSLYSEAQPLIRGIMVR